jgi:hypothetical protein
MPSLWIIERNGTAIDPDAPDDDHRFSTFEEKSEAEYNSDDGDVIVEYRRVRA